MDKSRKITLRYLRTTQQRSNYLSEDKIATYNIVSFHKGIRKLLHSYIYFEEAQQLLQSYYKALEVKYFNKNNLEVKIEVIISE